MGPRHGTAEAHVQSLRVLGPLVCVTCWAETWTELPTSLKHLACRGLGNPFFLSDALLMWQGGC